MESSHRVLCTTAFFCAKLTSTLDTPFTSEMARDTRGGQLTLHDMPVTATTIWQAAASGAAAAVVTGLGSAVGVSPGDEQAVSARATRYDFDLILVS